MNEQLKLQKLEYSVLMDMTFVHCSNNWDFFFYTLYYIKSIFLFIIIGLGSEEDSDDNDSTVDVLLRNKMSNFS